MCVHQTCPSLFELCVKYDFFDTCAFTNILFQYSRPFDFDMISTVITHQLLPYYQIIELIFEHGDVDKILLFIIGVSWQNTYIPLIELAIQKITVKPLFIKKAVEMGNELVIARLLQKRDHEFSCEFFSEVKLNAIKDGVFQRILDTSKTPKLTVEMFPEEHLIPAVPVVLKCMFVFNRSILLNRIFPFEKTSSSFEFQFFNQIYV